MLTGLDISKLWKLYKEFDTFQVICIKDLSHYERPYDFSSIIQFTKGKRYACFRIGASEIYFGEPGSHKGSMYWDCFIKHFDIPKLSRNAKLEMILK